MKEMIRVLIADDSAAFGKACQKELKSGGFDCVLTQKDGNRVISLLDTQHFDVVVMDVFMSGADALEVLEHMEPMAEKPLVLLLSSMDTPEFEEQMIRQVRTTCSSSRYGPSRWRIESVVCPSGRLRVRTRVPPMCRVRIWI